MSERKQFENWAKNYDPETPLLKHYDSYTFWDSEWKAWKAATKFQEERINALEKQLQNLHVDARRLDWIAMYGSFSVDSVTGLPGGNGQKHKAATRMAIDNAIEKQKTK